MNPSYHVMFCLQGLCFLKCNQISATNIPCKYMVENIIYISLGSGLCGMDLFNTENTSIYWNVRNRWNPSYMVFHILPATSFLPARCTSQAAETRCSWQRVGARDAVGCVTWGDQAATCEMTVWLATNNDHHNFFLNESQVDVLRLVL